MAKPFCQAAAVRKYDCLLLISQVSCVKGEMLMLCQPPHPDSITALRRLQYEVKERGDECLGMLLAGIDLYTAVGREWELLEVMRKFAHDAEEWFVTHPLPPNWKTVRTYRRSNLDSVAC